LNEPFEIVDQGELNHLGRKSRALRIDEAQFAKVRFTPKWGTDPLAALIGSSVPKADDGRRR
jgi:hypothetical protein